MFVSSLIIALVVLVGYVGMRRRGTRHRSFEPTRDVGLRAARGMGVAVLAFATGASLFLVMGTANAVIVPTIDLGTASDFSVLAGTTVTNTGNSVLNGSVGVSPGTAIAGFPPGTAATVEAGPTSTAPDAQLDLTDAYLDAAARPLDQTVTADLTGLTLVGGVYAGPSKAALSLPGTLTLDGEGNPNSVFIFQTDSTLITGPGSTVSLINGAQACNVFWQVGSSATLGGGSSFVGNILALTAISVEGDVTVQGRALARNAGVTLIGDTFTQVGCDLAPATTTTTTTATTTTAVDTTATTVADTTTTTVPADTTATTVPTSLPFTGQDSFVLMVVGMTALVLGFGVLRATPGRTRSRE